MTFTVEQRHIDDLKRPLTVISAFKPVSGQNPEMCYISHILNCFRTLKSYAFLILSNILLHSTTSRSFEVK